MRTHHDSGTFKALATAFYRTDTLRHTLGLTVVERFVGVQSLPEPKMATLHNDQGDVIGVALRTPPWPLIVSGLPTDPRLLDEFVSHWVEVDPDVPGANGPRENVEAMAATWARVTGGTTQEVMAGRLYRLGDLVPPTTTGRPRHATPDDVDMLADWRTDFEIEAVGGEKVPGSSADMVRRMLRMGDSSIIWEDAGKPVAWAVASAPIGGMSRVGPVYTVPAHRGHGYGSAVTAAVSQHVRDAGARDVLLFTNLANPTSNSIYQKIGYRPVYDSAEWEFGQLPSTT